LRLRTRERRRKGANYIPARVERPLTGRSRLGLNAAASHHAAPPRNGVIDLHQEVKQKDSRLLKNDAPRRSQQCVREIAPLGGSESVGFDANLAHRAKLRAVSLAPVRPNILIDEEERRPKLAPLAGWGPSKITSCRRRDRFLERDVDV